MLTPDQIEQLPADTKKEYLKAALLLDQKKKDQSVRDDFLSFVKYMWPEFIEGEHQKLCQKNLIALQAASSSD